MPQLNDLSRSLKPFVQDRTLVTVIELSLSSWLVAGVVSDIERQPLKKLVPDEAGPVTTKLCKMVFCNETQFCQQLERCRTLLRAAITSFDISPLGALDG